MQHVNSRVQALRNFLTPLAKQFVSFSISRKGTITKRVPQVAKLQDPTLKLAVLALGSVLIGFGVSLMLHADLGLPPFDVFLSGISRQTGLSHGQASWAAGAVLYSIAALIGKRPNMYNLLFVVFVGYSVDVSNQLIMDPEQLPVRVVFSALGVLLITVGVSAMVFSGLRPGSFELFMAAAEERGHSRLVVRSALEWTAFLTGLALSGTFGVASVLAAVSFGPLMNAQLVAFEDMRIGREARRPPAVTTS